MKVDAKSFDEKHTEQSLVSMSFSLKSLSRLSIRVAGCERIASTDFLIEHKEITEQIHKTVDEIVEKLLYTKTASFWAMFAAIPLPFLRQALGEEIPQRSRFRLRRCGAT